MIGEGKEGVSRDIELFRWCVPERKQCQEGERQWRQEFGERRNLSTRPVVVKTPVRAKCDLASGFLMPVVAMLTLV